LARTYRKRIDHCEKEAKVFKHLGLSATPRRIDDEETRQLRSIFTSGKAGVLYEVSPQELWKRGILARPAYAYELTQQTADKNATSADLAYFRQFRELSTHMAETLAKNSKRNALIADTYKKRQRDFGKTLVFALNRAHCVQLNDAFRKRGIRSDFVISHLEGEKNAAEANRDKIMAFKRGDLDVLVNVQILTEGADIPDIRTVFLTRPTNSPVLLAQMVGRALRGRKAKGKKDVANIVSFQDNWNLIQEWLHPEEVGPALEVEEREPSRRIRGELSWISIAVLQRIARQLDDFETVEGEFLEFVPHGWYSVSVETDDGTQARQPVIVYSQQVAAFQEMEPFLRRKRLPKTLDAQKAADLVEELWRTVFRPVGEPEPRSEDIEDIVRYWCDKGAMPPYFLFQDRDHCSMEDLVTGIRARDLRASEAEASLQDAFTPEGLWYDIFGGDFSRFMRAYRLVELKLYTPAEDRPVPKFVIDPSDDDRHMTDELRERVLKRDGYLCLNCGARRHLQMDHIRPYSLRGSTSFDNLQTLCKWCNARKGTETIDYRKG
jgi:superfamily II DNA or RNA helicase